jgi:hypothetical protein
MRLLCAVILALLCYSISRAEDWNVNGKVYQDVKVVKVDDDIVSIQYVGGVGRISIADLTPDLQKRFNYDAAKAQAVTEKRKEEQDKSDAETAKMSANKAKQLSALAQVIQVLPTGFLCSIQTKQGQLATCFVKCNTKGVIDGQSWTGTVIPFGTFSYTDTEGSPCTVAQFTTDLTAIASEMPQFQGYPRRPVSSSQSVGGG